MKEDELVMVLETAFLAEENLSRVRAPPPRGCILLETLLLAGIGFHLSKGGRRGARVLRVGDEVRGCCRVVVVPCAGAAGGGMGEHGRARRQCTAGAFRRTGRACPCDVLM